MKLSAPSSVAPAGPFGFDYSSLDHGTACRLKQAAEEIRDAKRGAARSIIHIGVQLLEVKGCLEHGKFGAWLKREFGWSKRTAQSYMRAAEVFGGKSETVADLPHAFIYKLTARSTPPQIREKVVADLEAGHPIDCPRVTKEISRSRPGKSLAKLSRVEKSTQEATEILAILESAERSRLLRLLFIPGVLDRLREVTLKAGRQCKPSDEFPDLPDFLDRRTHRRDKAVHEQ
jgi:hypothetical protein